MLGWIRTTDWVNADVAMHGLDSQRWKAIVVGSFGGGMLALWLIPWFWLDLPLLLAAWIAPLAVYIVRAEQEASGMTNRCSRATTCGTWRAIWLKPLGVKIGRRRPIRTRAGPRSRWRPRRGRRGARWRAICGGAAVGRPAAGPRSSSPTALASRAAGMLLDFTPTSVAVRHTGRRRVVAAGEPGARAGRPALAGLKLLCGLKVEERRARQDGNFSIEYRRSSRSSSGRWRPPRRSFASG